MKTRTVLLLFLIVSLAVAFNLYAQTGAAKGHARVAGKITDKSGAPLEDVVVKFSSDHLKTSFEVKTNKKGEFSIAGMAGGDWNVDFTKEGYKNRPIIYPVMELSYNKPIDVSLEKAVAAPPPREKVPGIEFVDQANKLREAKDCNGAIAQYQQAIQVNPNLYAVYGDIARCYVELGDKDKAIAAYQQFLAKEPANADAKIELANVMLSKGSVDDAKKTLADADMSTVTNPYVLYNLGVNLYNAKETQEAIKYWEKTIAMSPKMSDAYLQLGFAYYSLNDQAKAKQMLQKVVELEPGSENAKNAQEMLATMK